MIYHIIINENYRRMLSVTADCEKDALKHIDRAVARGDIILTDEDYFGREIKVVPQDVIADLQEKYLQ